MKIVQKSEKKVFRFQCKHCGSTLEANNNEFRFVKKGTLEYDCPVCKKARQISEKKITIEEVFTEIKNSNPKNETK